MFRVGNIVYLSDEENEKLLANELNLTKINHMDNEEDVPEEYPFKYTVGKDIDLF